MRLTPRDQEALDHFERWREAKMRSDETLAFDDAIVTAKAWAKFQELFCEPLDRRTSPR